VVLTKSTQGLQSCYIGVLGNIFVEKTSQLDDTADCSICLANCLLIVTRFSVQDPYHC
jgi:hypothetical protein